METIKITNIISPPAYTDGSFIYLSYKLNQKEREVAIFHEKGHIRLRHFQRAKNAKIENQAVWNISCDIEIAAILYPIYNYNNYISNLTKRSLLYGGITFPFIQDKSIMAELTAEEIYSYLQKKTDEQKKNLQELIEKAIKEDSKKDSKEEDIENIGNIKDIIDNFKKTLLQEKLEKDKKEEIKNNDLAQFFDAIAPKKHKLHCSIEKEIRQLKNISLGRESTYAIPNRRQECKPCTKGVRTTLTPAKVAVFVDCSGSFNEDKTRESEKIINELEHQYRGGLKFNKFYFSAKIGKTRQQAGEGQGTNYQQVFREIKNLSPVLSIIITDSDNCQYPCVDILKLKVLVEIIGSNYDEAPIVNVLNTLKR